MNNSEIVYRQMLQKSLNRITDEILLLGTQNNKLMNMITSSERRIEKLKIEREEILQELKERQQSNTQQVENAPNAFLDNQIVSTEEKTKSHAKRISELEELKKQTSSNIARAIMNRRINHERKKIARLKSTKNIISDVQKAIMLPKHIIDKYRFGKYAKRQGNVNYYENKVEEIKKKQENIKEDNIITKVQSAYYDIKGKYYAKKLEKSKKLLNRLQQKGIKNKILGANVAAMNKKDIDKFRQRMNTQTLKKSLVASQESEKNLPAIIQQVPIPENITAASLAEDAIKSQAQQQKVAQEGIAMTKAA